MAEESSGSADIGMFGLGVMGRNLALNIARRGFGVAVYDREPAVVREVTDAAGGLFMGANSPAEFVRLLKRPRRIILLVKAGAPVDWSIEQVRPFLDTGDILVDGGNSHFLDTERRQQQLSSAGLRFVGSGVSGGERGALEGPSLMPGGDRAAYEEIRPIWEAIAARTDDGACVTYIGGGGSGHFVKMVHNGIEYGDMQLIAEAYDLMRRLLGLQTAEMADIFARWNEGELESYLIEITAKILRVADTETGRPLVEMILDRGQQKGTGKWASAAALELGVILPTINAAVDARTISTLKEERVEASRLLNSPEANAHESTNDEYVSPGDPQRRNPGDLQHRSADDVERGRQERPPEMARVERTLLLDAIGRALYASKICSYAQGMNLIRAGSEHYGWGINPGETARIWKGGCIIRARFLGRIKEAYERRPDLPNLLLDPDFRRWTNDAQRDWRRIVALAAERGIPTPAISASLNYLDLYRTANLPLNLTQAQRDFFGAHTYERVDRPGQFVHTDWEAAAEEPRADG